MFQIVFVFYKLKQLRTNIYVFVSKYTYFWNNYTYLYPDIRIFGTNIRICIQIYVSLEQIWNKDDFSDRLCFSFWNEFLSSAQGVILFNKISRMIVWKKIVKKLVFGAGLGILKFIFLSFWGVQNKYLKFKIFGF